MEYGVCIVELDMLSKSHSPKGALNLNTLGPPGPSSKTVYENRRGYVG